MGSPANDLAIALRTAASYTYFTNRHTRREAGSQSHGTPKRVRRAAEWSTTLALPDGTDVAGGPVSGSFDINPLFGIVVVAIYAGWRPEHVVRLIRALLRMPPR